MSKGFGATGLTAMLAGSTVQKNKNRKDKKLEKSAASYATKSLLSKARTGVRKASKAFHKDMSLGGGKTTGAVLGASVGYAGGKALNTPKDKK